MAKPYAKSFYKSKSWRDCRESYISKVNGLCERCKKNGEIVGGHIVHHVIHITPSNINDTMITLNHDNLMFVCHSCHEVIHKGEKLATREGITFDEEGNVIENGS